MDSLGKQETFMTSGTGKSAAATSTAIGDHQEQASMPENSDEHKAAGAPVHYNAANEETGEERPIGLAVPVSPSRVNCTGIPPANKWTSPSFGTSMKNIRKLLVAKWFMSILLIAIPVSWILHWVIPTEPIPIFFVAFVAIIPLASFLGDATEEISKFTSQAIAGVINATLGNIVEVIVSIIAIVKCELQVVQSSLVGSILSNGLLVLGMCFFCGGVKAQESGLGNTATQTHASLLSLSVIGLLLPAAYHFSIQPSSGSTGSKLTLDEEKSRLLNISHGIAVVLGLVYCMYIFFAYFTHKDMMDDNSSDIAKSVPFSEDVVKFFQRANNLKSKATLRRRRDCQQGNDISPGHVEANGGEVEEDEEKPIMNLTVAIMMLCVIGALVGVTAEWLVDSIDGLTSQIPSISKQWVGLILLPIVGNAAEHWTAVVFAARRKLTLSLNVALGSSTQIALFVIPLSIIIAWIIDKPLSLLFDPFESIALFFSVMTVNYALADGKSNWLEGMILMCLYVILAVLFWFYPGSNITETFTACT